MRPHGEIWIKRSPEDLQYLLIDFRQTFVTGASWDTDDLITFLGQKVKVERHTIALEAHSTRWSTCNFFQLFFSVVLTASDRTSEKFTLV